MPVWLLSFGLKAFGFVKQAFQAAVSLVTRYPLQCALAVCLCACAWLWRANNGLHDTIKAERARYAEMVANFRDAQAKAELAQKANLARVAIQQRNITDETLDDYNRRVADLRERYKRLLAQGNRSASGNPDLPTIPDATSGIDEAPKQDGLPAADALTASEQALQLDALITWVERQAKVENSPQ
jgi:hypothetical protein